MYVVLALKEIVFCEFKWLCMYLHGNVHNFVSFEETAVFDQGNVSQFILVLNW